MSIIEFLQNKNVFVFDTETTGLPEKTQKWGTYWDYSLNDKYESARIVSIAWSSIANFDKNNIDTKNIEHYIRYPEGFTEITNSNIHGITLQDALIKGISFGFILSNYGLVEALLSADYILAHNVKFDYHVLMNELYRIVNTNEPIIPIALNSREHVKLCMEHMQNLYNNKRIICTGELTTNICKMEFPSGKLYFGKKKNYKMPKLCELYKFLYGYDFENAHSADGDVKALLECMIKL